MADAADRAERAERAERLERQERAERAERADKLMMMSMQQTTQTTQTALNAQTGMVAAAVASTASVASSAASAAAASAASAVMQVSGQSSTNYFKIVRPDGSQYEGQMRGEKPQGAGKLEYGTTTSLLVLPTGARFSGSIEGGEYDGSFSNGEREGRGKFRFKGTDFKTYDGMWADDAMCGQGKLTWRDGSTYTGVFKDGHMWGAGEFEKCDAAGNTIYIVKAGFVKGSIEGRGEVSFFPTGAPAGTKTHCIGTFVGGEMTYGDIRYSPGDPFQRNFYRGPTRGISPPVPHGPQGRLDYVNGDYYTGSFENDFPHGQGQKTMRDGGVYTGGFAQGKFNGEGKLVLGIHAKYNVFAGERAEKSQTAGPRGPITYAGGFVDDLFEGVGSYSCKTFSTIGRATFRRGKLHGFVQRQKYDKPTHSKLTYRKAGNFVDGASEDDKALLGSVIAAALFG